MERLAGKENRLSSRVSWTVNDEVWLEICNIGHGVFAPLTGFLDSKDYASVVERMQWSDGTPWTIPITLDIPEGRYQEVMKASSLILLNTNGEEIAELAIEDVYRIHEEHDLPHIFGTDDPSHPGVAKEKARSPYRVGGTIRVLRYMEYDCPEFALTPGQAREAFQNLGWKTITGFQTRNPIHRAHEYLQRVALEVSDGLLIHPLLGWKKKGDFTSKAILEAYQIMREHFYPKHRVILSALWTPMRYAGPREAVFHAIIRKNFGCTHFIVGRDHAGVGSYYDRYEAQALCSTFKNLGIHILALCGPYFCRRCDGIVTEKTCPHGDQFKVDISGTELRAFLRNGQTPPTEYMRPEITNALLDLAIRHQLFIP